MLSDVASAALEAIDELNRTEDSDWLDFSWKLTALSYVQDIFAVVIQPSDDPLVWFQQYYFYYESRVILAESVLAGLNGLYTAEKALLRPFLEFTLLQNYYHRAIRDSGTYAPIEQYFAKRKHPSWGTVLRNALPNDSFCRPIRFRIQAHLAGLSESAAHPYHPDFSPIQHRGSEHGHSLEGMFFWQTTKLILEAALWAYYVNFPLLFHPVDVLRKFGYNGPAGIVVDRQCGEAVKHSLLPDDYEAFRQYSLSQQATQDVVQWVASFPDLTDAQIRATWNEKDDGPFPGLWKAYGLRMAKFRALRLATAFRRSREQQVPEQLISDVECLAGWRRISRRGRTRGQ